MELTGRVLNFIRDYGLVEPGDHVICAVSGGKDSMALLWAMYLLREKLDMELSAAHFNHSLRGAESDRDEAFVWDFCRDYHIPLALGRGTVACRGRGLEDAARQARYAFLEGLEAQAKIATAHTAQDNAETVLLHLLRGTGLRGLGGIPPRRGRVIRPMLQATGEEVAAFLRQWSIPHVEDSSNRGMDFLRNRLRQQVLPVFCRENPAFARSASRTALELRRDEALLEELAERAMEQVRAGEGLDCRALLELHPALRRRVLEHFLREAGVPEPETVHLDRAEALATSERPSAWGAFPGGVVLTRRYGLLVKETGSSPLTPTVPTVPGLTRVGDWEVQCKILSAGKKFQNTPFTFYFACDRIKKSSLLLRPRSVGDRLRMSGGTKSLKKLLIDRKIPASQRDGLPVLSMGDRVLGVAGVGADAGYAPEPGAPVLQIVFTKTI